MNNEIVVATLLIAFAVIAAAYEFNDPVFNQILADDLEDITSAHYLHPRNRRDEEAVDKCRPGQRRRRLCCADETLDQKHESEKEVKRECFRKIKGDKDKDKEREFDPFRCDKMDKHRRDMICVMQCVGQKKSLLDDEGNPKEEEFIAHVKEWMSKEPWFESIQDKVISACLDEARNATANRDTSDTESCNPAGAKLMHCMFREIQLGCPAEEIKDQKACSRTRERIKKHNDFPPPPPPFLHDD